MNRGWGGFAKGRKRDQGMNKLEADFDQELTRMLGTSELLWRSAYEPIKLRLADNTFYTPDFLGLPTDEILTIYEVKGGLFPEKNRTKLKVIAELFPFRVILCRRPKKADPWQYEKI